MPFKKKMTGQQKIEEIKKSRKSTNATIEQRCEELEPLVLSGLTRTQIWEYSVKNTDWGVCANTISRYMKRIMDRLSTECQPQRELEIKKAVRRFEKWIAQSELIQDWKSCADIQSRLNKLLGLNAPDGLKVDANVTTAIVSMADLHESLENIEGERKDDTNT